jgi:FlaA1/EpsC-like NDP-sugar epimerase
MHAFYRNKNILITGGCGSIGQLLTTKLLEFNPKVIRIFDTNEESLFKMRQKYSGTKEDKKLRFVLGDIRNLNRLQYALTDIDYVFHTASYKHVQECEYNPIDAIETNIKGTTNLIEGAINQNVKKVLYTSSDKAVNPTNTMGATKLLAEKLMIAANDYSAGKTVFASCRFGNVLDSSGSVIPLFKRQIQNKGTVTITDPNMTRFVITKEKAIELVLLSCYLSRNGEIFIFKMDVIKINDLADAMIEKYGNAKKQIIGKKPGEKLYEELMTEEEMARAYSGRDTYIVFPMTNDIDKKIYKDFKKVRYVKNSRDMKHLSKKQILRLLE